MSRKVIEYRCLLISPSDVTEERDALTHAIDLWNAQVGEALGARIHLVRWEADAVPDLSDQPQSVLNRHIVDDCDFGVALFWARLGSPTAEHESGSVEEITQLRTRGAQVLVYFKTAAVPQSLLKDDQFQRVRALDPSRVLWKLPGGVTRLLNG